MEPLAFKKQLINKVIFCAIEVCEYILLLSATIKPKFAIWQFKCNVTKNPVNETDHLSC